MWRSAMHQTHLLEGEKAAAPSKGVGNKHSEFVTGCIHVSIGHAPNQDQATHEHAPLEENRLKRSEFSDCFNFPLGIGAP